ncbi:MAG TPA: YbjN domain-containing protein [Steroidobacteraceae bacterium]|nr:YbjN domain-containing protein [Steroidobacteraceae bacterium]
MSDAVDLTKQKVQRYLTDLLGSVSLDRDGDFFVRNGSAQVFLRVMPFGEQNSLVRIWAPTNQDVPESPDLYRYIATNARFYFGALTAQPTGKSTANVAFSYTLLGEFLDPDELRSALSAVAVSADAIDDEIKTQFGGRRFWES